MQITEPYTDEIAITWPQNVLMIVAIMKLILIAAFFASFAFIGQGRAAERVQYGTCAGQNLLAKLEREEPALHARVLEEAAATENADAIFWKVEKDGHPTSWLLGTMHMSDPEISTIPEDVRQAILSSETLVIESIEALDQQSSAKAMASLAHLTLLREGTLRDLVEDSLEDELETAVTERGLSMALADRMQPWLIATTVALPVCELVRKQNGELVLDGALAAFAGDNGKQVQGLESVAEQLTAIASLPVEYHVSALEETLQSGSLAVDMIETMKDLYHDAQIGLVFPLMKAVMPNSGSDKGVANFQEALIDKRNRIMVERALPILRESSAVIAVGALHLPGEIGLVNLLRQSGYTVTPAR